ncbi:MAG TPA: chorismate mutase [Polyangiaceae bacterium]|nr:chorismate mutase [Polyangiaceae bacterium]
MTFDKVMPPDAPPVTDAEFLAMRREIDALDEQILELVAARIRIVLKVGDYKRARGMHVYDPERERQLLERIARTAKPPLDAETARRIFERLVDESRRIEQRHMTRKDEDSA